MIDLRNTIFINNVLGKDSIEAGENVNGAIIEFGIINCRNDNGEAVISLDGFTLLKRTAGGTSTIKNVVIGPGQEITLDQSSNVNNQIFMRVRLLE